MRNDFESNCLCHHGILGMKWGIRRYQNEDGSLTPLGRERLGYDKYTSQHKEDTVLKKGTKVTRGVTGLQNNGYKSDDIKTYNKTVKETRAREKELDTKYASVDGIKNSGRANGKEYYTAWFTDSGWSPDDMYMDTYTLNHDVRVASGEKVVNELIKQLGGQKIKDTIKEGKNLKSLTLEYTQNKELFKNVNESLVKQGYEAIEDINDAETDMPVIFLNSKNSLTLKYTQTGQEVIDEILKKK